jgi:hypothetical protein
MKQFLNVGRVVGFGILTLIAGSDLNAQTVYGDLTLRNKDLEAINGKPDSRNRIAAPSLKLVKTDFGHEDLAAPKSLLGSHAEDYRTLAKMVLLADALKGSSKKDVLESLTVSIRELSNETETEALKIADLAEKEKIVSLIDAKDPIVLSFNQKNSALNSVEVMAIQLKRIKSKKTSKTITVMEPALLSRSISGDQMTLTPASELSGLVVLVIQIKDSAPVYRVAEVR